MISTLFEREKMRMEAGVVPEGRAMETWGVGEKPPVVPLVVLFPLVYTC